jgi:hypothetical protein
MCIIDPHLHPFYAGGETINTTVQRLKTQWLFTHGFIDLPTRPLRSNERLSSVIQISTDTPQPIFKIAFKLPL